MVGLEIVLWGSCGCTWGVGYLVVPGSSDLTSFSVLCLLVQVLCPLQPSGHFYLVLVFVALLLHTGDRLDSYVCVFTLRRVLGFLHTSHSHACLFLFLSFVTPPSSVGVNTVACGCISSGPGIGVGRGLFL